MWRRHRRRGAARPPRPPPEGSSATGTWADRTWSSFVGTETSRNLGGVGAAGPLRHEAASLPYGLVTRASWVPGNRRFSSSVVVPINQGTATSNVGGEVQ